MRDGELKSGDLHGALSAVTFLIHPLHLLVLASGARDQKVVVQTSHRVCERCYRRLKIRRFTAPFLFIAGMVLLIYGGGHLVTILVHPSRGLLADAPGKIGAPWFWWMLVRGLFWLGIAVCLLRWSHAWFNSKILRAHTHLQPPFQLTGLDGLTGATVGERPDIFKLLGTVIPLVVIAVVIGGVIYILIDVNKDVPSPARPRRSAAQVNEMKVMVYRMPDGNNLALYNIKHTRIPSPTLFINGTPASGYYYTHPDTLEPHTAVLIPLDRFLKNGIPFDPSRHGVARVNAISADFAPIKVELAPVKLSR